jgi:hypothetical protein
LFRHRPASPTWTSKIILRNFKIDRSGSGNNNVDVVLINYAKFVMYDGIELIDDWRESHGDAGLVGYNNIVAVARNNIISNKSYGIWLFGYLNIMSNNYVENTAMVGIAGAGLLPDRSLPPGYSAGGVTIIENNVCVDCGRTDEAISIDYGADNPVINAFGIIRNNLIVGKNYSMKYPIAIVGVSHAIVESNKIEGTAMAAPLYVQWFKPVRHLIVRNNIIDIKQGQVDARPHLLADKIIMENNEIIIRSDVEQNNRAWVELWTNDLTFKGNKVSITLPPGYETDFAVQIIPLEDTDFVSFIENNYIEATTIRGIVRFGKSAPTRYVVFVKNIVKSVTSQSSFLHLDGNTNDITYYAIIKDNIVLGSLANSILVINGTPGKKTTAIIDGDIRIVTSGASVGKYSKRNSGTATIQANSTSVIVNHMLACTPAKVLITPLNQPTNMLWAESITDTSFTIKTSTAPSSNLTVAWYTEC